ncbi:uridine-cytidine kinase 2 [Venturia nashicola]|nr:uridine-cytidine kinase 2 [Venturia nashicola]
MPPTTQRSRKDNVAQKANYSPPWANTSIIGVAGSSGSGKTSLALAIVASLNLPWVVILSMDSFYKPLSPEQSRAAFRNEFDFDAPTAIDFDVLVDKLRDIKAGKRTEVPIYSFSKHAREEETSVIYSPHVLILEGIFALHDPRILELLDLKVFAEADADLCLSRRLLRDMKYRGRDIEGCIKQWFTFVKPNFLRYVQPQREVSDIIVPRGIENKVAISMVSDSIKKTLHDKSTQHQLELARLGLLAETSMMEGEAKALIKQTPQIMGMNTLLMDPTTDREDFIFYFDRVASLLVERATEHSTFEATQILTPQRNRYMGLSPTGSISAIVILRGGSALETGLKRVIPDCRTGRILIQTTINTTEPELHYLKLPPKLQEESLVLLLDAQMSSGGAALMAVKVLVDHGVREDKIVFVSYLAGKKGLGRLMSVFSGIRVVVGRIVDDEEERWVEAKYLGC